MNLSKFIKKITRRNTRSATRIIEYADLPSTLVKEERASSLIAGHAGSPLRGLNKVDIQAMNECKQGLNKDKNVCIKKNVQQTIDECKQESTLENFNVEESCKNDVNHSVKDKNQAKEIPKVGREISEITQAEEESSHGVYEVRRVFGGIKKLFEKIISRVPMKLKSTKGTKKSKKAIVGPEIMKTNSTYNYILNKYPVIDRLHLLRRLESERNRIRYDKIDLKIIENEEHDKRRYRVLPNKENSAQLETKEIVNGKLLREADKFVSRKKKVKWDEEKVYEDFYLHNAGTSLLWEYR